MLDFKDADLEDVTVYQVRYTHPVAETELLPEQFIRVTSAVKRVPIDITLNSSNEPANQNTATGMGDTNIFDKGWYVMSSGIWEFDLENKTHYIPVALGVGEVLRVQGKLMRPQFPGS